MQLIGGRWRRRGAGTPAPSRRGRGGLLVAAAAALAALTACGSGGEATRSVASAGTTTGSYGLPSYTRPAAASAGSYRTILPLHRDEAFDALVDWLAADHSFNALALDPAEGLIVAYYRGEPGPYVDCGLLTVRDERGEPFGPPAAAADVRSVNIDDRQQRYTGVRRWRLDARTTIQLDAAGAQTAVSASSQYVLTSMTAVHDPDNRVLARRAQVVDFASGDGVRFQSGVRCVATGRLERDALAAAARGHV